MRRRFRSQALAAILFLNLAISAPSPAQPFGWPSISAIFGPAVADLTALAAETCDATYQDQVRWVRDVGSGDGGFRVCQSGVWEAPEGGAGGSGDITAVGDCATGACFQAETARYAFMAPAIGGIATFRPLVELDISDLTPHFSPDADPSVDHGSYVAGHAIQENDTAKAQQPILNLISGGTVAVACVDDAPGTETDCTFTGSAHFAPTSGISTDHGAGAVAALTDLAYAICSAAGKTLQTTGISTWECIDTPTGALPGGTGNELQYRVDASTFGASTLTFDGTNFTMGIYASFQSSLIPAAAPLSVMADGTDFQVALQTSPTQTTHSLLLKDSAGLDLIWLNAADNDFPHLSLTYDGTNSAGGSYIELNKGNAGTSGVYWRWKAGTTSITMDSSEKLVTQFQQTAGHRIKDHSGATYLDLGVGAAADVIYYGQNTTLGLMNLYGATAGSGDVLRIYDDTGTPAKMFAVEADGDVDIAMGGLTVTPDGTNDVLVITDGAIDATGDSATLAANLTTGSIDLETVTTTSILDDEMLMGSGAGAAAYIGAPSGGTNGCSGAVSDKVLYNSATNDWSCGTDAGAGGGMTSFTVEGDDGAPGVTITDDNTLTVTGGAGILTEDDDATSDLLTLSTASGEADFLASGALTCGASTQGKLQTHTTPLQYCDNAATPVLQYAAYGDSTGKATIALDLQAAGSVVSNSEVDDDITLTNITQITTRAAESLTSSCTDVQVLGGTGASGVECQADDDVPEAADYSALTGGVGIDHAVTGTLTADLTEINSHTYGDNSQATITQTWDQSGAVTGDPIWTYSDGVANLSAGTLQAGGSAVILEGDSRLTDARTPTAHAASHSDGGGDEVTATNLGSPCTDVQVLGGTVGGTGVECQADDTGTDTLDDLSDDNPTALQNVTTINDGDYCQGNVSSGFDCDVTTLPDADVDNNITIDHTSAGTLTLDQTVAPTAEGVIAWDVTNEELEIGETTTTAIFKPVDTFTNGNFCTADTTGNDIDCGTSGSLADDDLSGDLITALSGVTTVTDGAICEGGAGSSMDCDLASSGTGNVARVDSPTFTTAITVPADSISDEELDESATFTFTGTVDASGATRTAPNDVGLAPPGTCTIGDTFFDTDATAGQRDLTCDPANTWTAHGDGGGSETNSLETVMTGALSGEIPIGTTAGGLAAYVSLQACADDEKLEFTDGAPDTMTCEAIGGLVDADITFTSPALAAATATTPAADDNDTSVATTAFVQAETLAAGDTTGSIGGGISYGADNLDGDNVNASYAGAYLTETAATPDTLGVDTEVITRSFSFSLEDPVTGDSGVALQKLFGVQGTITRIECSTDAGTVTLNINERVRTTPDTTGVDALSAGLVCDTNSQSACASGCDVNTIQNQPIDALDIVAVEIDAVSGAGWLRGHVVWTVDDV